MTRAQAIWHAFERPHTPIHTPLVLASRSCAGFAPSNPAIRGASVVATSPCARCLFAALAAFSQRCRLIVMLGRHATVPSAVVRFHSIR